MAIIYTIEYRKEVVAIDIPSISHELRAVIKHQIEKKLTYYPELFGKPLRNTLAGFRSLCIGDYRVIYEIVLPKKVAIRVIQHRGKTYIIAEKRLLPS